VGWWVASGIEDEVSEELAGSCVDERHAGFDEQPDVSS
jgi:hypothetical protein